MTKKSISIAQMKLLQARYGSNWEEVLKCIPTETERKKLRAKRKKKIKQKRKK